MGTGLFFGTFNPVHRGHEELVSSFLASEWVDDLWIILTPSPPHKHMVDIAPFADRWNMLEKVFADRKGVRLSDIEQRISSPHYTVRTLTFLRNSYPDRSFYLCIGSDTLQTLPTWYEFEKIAHKIELIVAKRPGISTSKPPEPGDFTVHYCEHREKDISSTSIRKALSEGHAPGPDILNPAVLNYIQQEGLYGVGRKRVDS